MKPRRAGGYERTGANMWRRPLDLDDREFFSYASVEIEPELEAYCDAAIPLQWFEGVDFKMLGAAADVARSLAERDFVRDKKVVLAELGEPAFPEQEATQGEHLQSAIFRHYTPLLALILFRTALCSPGPQTRWNGPLEAASWFGRLLGHVSVAKEPAGLNYDPLLACFATAVEMGLLPLREQEEPGFQSAVPLWAKYTELLLRTVTSRGGRLNGAAVRSCVNLKQAVGFLQLGAHPSSVAAALWDFENGEIDFLGQFGRACLTFNISADDACQEGGVAALASAVPQKGNWHDELFGPDSTEDDPGLGGVGSGKHVKPM